MAKLHHRIGALVIALLFLATSVGFSIVVILQARNQNKQTTQNNQANQTTTNPEENQNMLQGTKLENFTPVTEVPELQITDLKEGTGEVVPEGATVTAHYTGALAKDGTIFQSSHDMGQPIPFSLNGVIEGWKKGVPGMKVGGVRRLVIPAGMAYGETGSPPTIGPNEPLVFDIEVVKIGE